MMTEKTVNYTPEQVQQLVQDYQSGVSVEQIAQQLGKSVRSVVAKLSREGVYQPKTRSSSGARVTKAQLVQQIAKLCDRNDEQFESLEKASVEVLTRLLEVLCG
jgi:transposase-like protein